MVHQAPELRGYEIDITPFDCPVTTWAKGFSILSHSVVGPLARSCSGLLALPRFMRPLVSSCAYLDVSLLLVPHQEAFALLHSYSPS